MRVMTRGSTLELVHYSSSISDGICQLLVVPAALGD